MNGLFTETTSLGELVPQSGMEITPIKEEGDTFTGGLVRTAAIAGGVTAAVALAIYFYNKRGK